jgi:hypothetical protein
MVNMTLNVRWKRPIGSAMLSGCCGLVTDAHGAQSAGDECAVDPVPITDPPNTSEVCTINTFGFDFR